MRELSADLTAEQARAWLEAQHLEVIGVGDWATVLARPDDEWCVRLVPVDPAYRLFVDDLIAGPPHPALPRIRGAVALRGDAYSVVLERLYLADEDAARRFCDRLPDDEVLWPRLTALEARGAARYPHLWGGFDLRPGNVTADRSGVLKVIDPVFLAGQKLVDALRSRDVEALADLTPSEIEAFPRIACFHREHDRYDLP